MPENAETQNTPSLVDRLEAIRSGQRAGNEVRSASAPVDVNPNAVQGLAVTYRHNGVAGGDNVDPLRKNFETAASMHPVFKQFGSTKALDDPRGYLRETYEDINGKRKYKVSSADLDAMILGLLHKGRGKEGTPIEQVSAESGQPGLMHAGLEKGLSANSFGRVNMELSKALDSSGGSGGPLIRQDIEPLIYEVYLRRFPLFEQIRKFPANGLLHSYNQRTSVGTADTVAELGDLAATESQSTYTRKLNSNIAIVATRRQISLKLQYASNQSGVNFNLDGGGNLEVVGALTAMARKVQSLIAQGNYGTAGKTASDEEGLTDINGFDGLRTILKDSTTSINKGSSDDYLRVINRAVADVVNSGGDPNDLAIMCSLYAKMDIESEFINFLRLVNGAPGGIPSNMASNGILTVADTLSRLMPIPAASQGEGLGYYTYSGNATEDLNVVDPNGMGLAYLGSPTPQILEMPIGYNNALSNVYIPFTMVGLVVFVNVFHRKIRIARVTS